MLTSKGRAAALLIRVRDSWDSLTPAQQAECSAILGRLSVALRAEEGHVDVTFQSGIPQMRRASAVPIIGRLTA